MNLNLKSKSQFRRVRVEGGPGMPAFLILVDTPSAWTDRRSVVGGNVNPDEFDARDSLGDL